MRDRAGWPRGGISRRADRAARVESRHRHRRLAEHGRAGCRDVAARCGEGDREADHRCAAGTRRAGHLRIGRRGRVAADERRRGGRGAARFDSGRRGFESRLRSFRRADGRAAAGRRHARSAATSSSSATARIRARGSTTRSPNWRSAACRCRRSSSAPRRGSTIPRPEGGGDLVDDNGQVVTTYARPEVLQKIAARRAGSSTRIRSASTRSTRSRRPAGR